MSHILQIILILRLVQPAKRKVSLCFILLGKRETIRIFGINQPFFIFSSKCGIKNVMELKLFIFFNSDQGNLRGEPVAAAIMGSHNMEQSYCTSRFFRS